MKNNTQKSFLVFFFLFYLLMAIGSFLQIMYFTKTHYLSNFGFFYGAMAISGAIIQIYFIRIQYLAPKTILNMGLIIYGISMLLRIFSDSLFLSIISGVLGGVGATLVIVLMRIEILNRAEEINMDGGNRLIGTRYLIIQSTSLIGTIISGILLVNFFKTIDFLPISIFSVGVLMIMLAFWPKHINAKLESSRKFEVLPKDPLLIKIFLNALLIGLLVAMIEPLIPAIFLINHISVGNTTILTIFTTLLGLLGGTIFRKKIIANNAVNFLAGIGLFIGTVFILSYFSNIILLIGIFAFSIMSPGYFQLKEIFEFRLIQHSKITKAELVAYSQTAYLVGDSIGAPIMTHIIYIKNGLVAWELYGIVSLLFAFSVWYFWIKNKSVKIPETK